MAQGTKEIFCIKYHNPMLFAKVYCKRKGDAFAPPSQTKPKQRLVVHFSVKDVVHPRQFIGCEEQVSREIHILIGKTQEELPGVAIQLSVVVKLKSGLRVRNRTLFDGLVINYADAGCATESVVANQLNATGSNHCKLTRTKNTVSLWLKEEVGLSVRVHHLLKVNVHSSTAMRLESRHILVRELTTDDDRAIPTFSKLILIGYIGQEVIQENPCGGVFGLGEQLRPSSVYLTRT